jgi:hypothetical protein
MISRLSTKIAIAATMISRLSTKIAIAATILIVLIFIIFFNLFTPQQSTKTNIIVTDDESEVIAAKSASFSPKRKQQQAETSKETSIKTELDFTPIEPSLKNQNWSPLVCMPGTLLNSGKFQSNCKSGKVIPKEIFCGDEATKPLCGQYSAGKFSQTLSVKKSENQGEKKSLSSCSLKSHLEDKIESSNWFFDSNDKLKSKSCHFDYVTPQEIFSTLVSKSATSTISSQSSMKPFILFSGDSMTRQIFLRLISLIRSQLEEPIVEHYFHFDAVYFIFGGKYDVLIPIGMSAKIAASAVPSFLQKAVADELVRLSILSETSSVVQTLLSLAKKTDQLSFSSSEIIPTLTMMYQWETKPSKFRSDFMTLKPKVHIAAWMYWWQKKDPLSDFDGYAKAMDNYHQSLKNENPIYMYITTPWTKEGVFGGVDENIRSARNLKAVNWLRSSSEGKNGGSRVLLDYSAIADLKKFGKTKDEIHYMCIWQPKLPGAVMEQKNVAENRCVDKMNAAVAQVLVQSLMGL